MKRIAEANINTPQEYLRIYNERKTKGVDWFDAARWDKMLKEYKGGKLIDLGCLDSLIPFLAKDKHPYAEVWGLDFVKEVIDEYSEQYPGIYWVHGDVYETHLPSNSFDYIVAGELIEHLEHPEKMIREAIRLLKVGGTFVLSTPLGETKAGEIDHERHLWGFDQQDIEEMLKPYGSVKVKVMRSQYFPYKYHFPVIIAYLKKHGSS